MSDDVSRDVSEKKNVSENAMGGNRAGDRTEVRAEGRGVVRSEGIVLGRRGWRAARSTPGSRPIPMATMATMALAALLASPTAFGHDDPTMIPDGSDPIVRWYQPPGAPLVVDWDVETTPFELGAVPSIFPAQAVPDESCWALHLETDEPLRVRVRAVQDGLVSAWSDYTVVPEPGLSAALAVGVPLLLIAARSRRGRSRSTPGRGRGTQLPRRTITFFVWV